MKIAPARNSAPMADDQEARIIAWEASLGTPLPADYRTFLVRYDGGFPYPNLFDEVTPDTVRRGPDTLAICEQFYDLNYAISETSGATYGAAVPPHFALIGQDPGGLEFLLSLRERDFGAIFLWQGTTNRWGTDGNDPSRLLKQADSFQAFVDDLYDTPDKIGYDHWATPNHIENAVELRLN